VLLVVATSLASAGERDRKKLEQPLVPVPKLHCYSAAVPADSAPSSSHL
jgi:hypothetical protein